MTQKIERPAQEPKDPSYLAGQRVMQTHLEAGLINFRLNHHSPTPREVSEYVKQSAVEASNRLRNGWYPALNAAYNTEARHLHELNQVQFERGMRHAIYEYSHKHNQSQRLDQTAELRRGMRMSA